MYRSRCGRGNDVGEREREKPLSDRRKRWLLTSNSPTVWNTCSTLLPGVYTYICVYIVQGNVAAAALFFSSFLLERVYMAGWLARFFDVYCTTQAESIALFFKCPLDLPVIYGCQVWYYFFSLLRCAHDFFFFVNFYQVYLVEKNSTRDRKKYMTRERPINVFFLFRSLSLSLFLILLVSDNGMLSLPMRPPVLYTRTYVRNSLEASPGFFEHASRVFPSTTDEKRMTLYC